jgi:hypothetical protein
VRQESIWIRRAAAGLLLASALGVRAEDLRLQPRYDLVQDAVATGAAAAGTLTLMAFQKDLAPPSCKWCTPGQLDAYLSNTLRWHDTEAAARTSDVLALAVGAGALGYVVVDGYRRDDPETGWVNVLLIAEATSAAMFLDTSVKYAVGRQRPYAWRGETRPGDKYDRNLSFFSGHATFAFALAASSSELLLSQNAPHARTYAFVAYGAAATTAYLRVAADRHFASDALVGAAVGTLVGWAIPHYFHSPSKNGVQLVPAPGGLALVW